MLLVDATRRRCASIPVLFPVIGLGLALAAVALVSTQGVGEALLLGGVALLVLGYGIAGIRRARREGDAIVVRTVLSTRQVPADGSAIDLVQGGGSRSPHLDVLLRPESGEPLALARFETFGMSRAPRAARRIAEALAVPVHEAGLAPFEAQFAEVAKQQRAAFRWLGMIVAVGLVASVVMTIVADRTMATLVIRCPGGEVRERGATMLDGLEMTTDPGTRTFELRPPDGPAWTQRVELVAGQTTVLDCRARP